uniref:Flavin-containing monooxygenase n=1 Tax=Cupiennius salei TaxID=6928 RepID=T1DCI0_CUPSA
MASKKMILVIGGGFGGLGAVKSLKEEGFEPVCYEKTPHKGGTWFYRHETPMGLPSIMPTTVINHSKEMGTISNYVPNKRLPNYMPHTDLLKTFNDVGEKFDCFKHFVCQREVLKVKQSADYDETGRWDVRVKNTETGEILEETYDGVMVCTGHITYPKMALYPGMEEYQGEIMHTHNLKGLEPYKGKKVVVVGIGCSGLDAAVEVSNVASQVYLSTRSGAWIFPRVGPLGLPLDFALMRRCFAYFQDMFGYKIMSWILENLFLNRRFNHNLYNLRPLHPAMCKDPVVNDLLPARVITGSVLIKKDIKCFSEKGIVFENETKVTEADVVIMATGYTWKFPFLEDDIIRTEGNRINLYKCMYPPHLKHPSLAIIGFLLPFGPGFPMGEIQCRWAVQVFSGKSLPPCQKEMMADIIKRHEENSKRFFQSPSEKMSIRVDFVQYQDEIASQIGAKPNMWKFLFTDPTLFWALMFGPSLPYQYRLQGPHKWDGARNAILTVYDRVRFPFSGEEHEKSKKLNLSSNFLIKYLMIFLLIAFWLYNSETSVKYYLLALILPYIMTWKGFFKKYFACLFLLPFYLSWSCFVSSYFVTILVPVLIASLTLH